RINRSRVSFPTRRSSDLQIVFSDDRHLPLCPDSDAGLIEDYRQAADLCVEAGFAKRTDSLVGSISIVRAGEDLEARAQLATVVRSEEHTSELQSRENLVC